MMKISKITQRKEKNQWMKTNIRKRIHKAKSWLFERSNKPLKKTQKTQPIRNETSLQIPQDWRHYKFIPIKMKILDEINKFLQCIINKVKWKVKADHLCSILCDPINCIPTGSLCQWDSPDKNTGVGCHFLLQGNLPDPGIEPRSTALQADSLPSEPPGKPNNYQSGNAQ